MSRPSDHIDAGRDGFEARDRHASTGARARAARGEPARAAGPLATAARTLWRQLTSMRVALILLLLLAVAAVPGSLVPQRLADPNGVSQFTKSQPELAKVYDALQLFDVYSSAWFTAIYLLLFVSLVGCIIPRILHHWRALRSQPPATPARLDRLDAYSTLRASGEGLPEASAVIAQAQRLLRQRGYRTAIVDQGRRGLSVSAERGYLRETGNLVFHIAMLGIIVAIGALGGTSWHGQRVLVEGQTFVNGLVGYSSFTPGRFFSPDELEPYAVTLDSFEVAYEEQNPNALGAPIAFDANVTVQEPGQAAYQQTVRVNDPLRVSGTDVYLLANGYAPEITVRNAEGVEVFRDHVVFIPQDKNLTGLGVVKLPDGLGTQLGMIGFFYPTVATLESGALTSSGQDLADPMLTLNVYEGDLGLDDGVPRNVYELDTSTLTQIAGGKSDVNGLRLRPGETVELPNGLGSVTLGDIPRYASFDILKDPTQLPVAIFAGLVLLGLFTSLLVPRRRIWVKATAAGGALLLEYAGLARGEDPKLVAAVNGLLDAHADDLVGSRAQPAEADASPASSASSGSSATSPSADRPSDTPSDGDGAARADAESARS